MATKRKKKQKKPEYTGPLFIIHEVECICQNPHTRILAHSAPSYFFEIFQRVDPITARMIAGVYACDNCGRLWSVDEIGGDGAELAPMDMPTTYSIRNLKKTLPVPVVNAFDSVQASAAKYAWASWILAEKKFPSSIIIGTRADHSDEDNVIFREFVIKDGDDFDLREISTSTIATL